jgi:uncharacterized protein (DUF58 family)
MKISKSLKIVIVLLALSLVGVAVSDEAIYSRLSYFWIFLILGNWVWSRLTLQGVEFKRQALLRRAQVGQTFEERLDIKNLSRIPIVWVEVRDESELPGSRGSRVHTRIGGREGRSHLVRTRLIKRGAFQLGPTVLASADPFGLFPVTKSVPSESSIVVYPLLVEIASFPNPPGLLPGGEALRRRTHQITPNASSVRDYAPGDPMNRIHWPSTARRNKLIVKEFELDPLAEVWCFVDSQKAGHFEEPFEAKTTVDDAIFRASHQVQMIPSTEEYAATCAASLSRYYLRRGRAFALVTGGDAVDVITPDRGGRQLGKILEALSLWKASADLPFAALVAGQARHLPRGSTVVLVTTSQAKNISVTVDQLMRLGLRPVVVLIDPSTFGADWSLEEQEADLRSLGIPVTRICKDDDIGEALSLTAVWGLELAFPPMRVTQVL